jgi:nitrate/TMAO reductase-like tetraheme cytochrome c subunit
MSFIKKIRDKLWIFIKSRTFRLLVAGAFAGIVLFIIATALFLSSSETEFCISCHEMQIVAEQGWMKSSHFGQNHGIVAECVDCHVEPEIAGMIWTKTRDGLHDVWVHHLGESDPHKMDWDKLSKRARSKIKDSSCRRCHKNDTPAGASVKMIIAHRAAKRMNGKKRCVDCHTKEFHGKFKQYLSDYGKIAR